jgi:hypothetical protein
LISLAALWLFGGITEDVIHHDPLTPFDPTWLDWFHGHATSTGLPIFGAISWLGSPAMMTALGLVVANECVVPSRERLTEVNLRLEDSALFPGAARSSAPASLTAC